MKLLVLLAAAAVALARMPSVEWERTHFEDESYSIEERSFKRGAEYQFKYEGQVAVGIPGASRQHSATRIQALVSLVLKGDDKALLKIHQVRMGRLNRELFNPRAMVPFMAFEEVPMDVETKERLMLPVMFSYNQGLVSELVFDKTDSPWSENIKKGMLNLLQVNLGKRGEMKQTNEESLLNRVSPSAESEEAKFETFSTKEKSVEGECETLYTVVSNPVWPMINSRVLNVTRTIEFENCAQRPEIKYNFRFQDPCLSCEPKYESDQKFLKSSSVAKFNISGTRQNFLIESALLESQYQLVPFNRDGNMITTYVNQTLRLLRAGPIRSSGLRAPSNPVNSDSDLMYSLEWDKEMELFQMKGHNHAKLPVDVKNRNKIVAEIIRPLISEMRECVGTDVPVAYARLVKMLRLAEKEQLESIFSHFVHKQPESFSTEEHVKIKSILIDALADCGTKDAVSFLLQLIQDNNIEPIRAAITLKHLINIRTPSKEIVREFLAFLDSQPVKRSFFLKQSAYLTLGSIVQGLCMPSEERLAILPRPSSDKLPRRSGPNTHLCPTQLQDTLIQKLFRMVSSGSVEEKMLALKTVGNMGLPKSIVELEPLIRCKSNECGRYPRIVRLQAILALRQLRESLPQKVQHILLPIFMSKYEPNELRMAAVAIVFDTMPARPVLDQIARKLFAERSHQVASFVYSYMTTLANSTTPCELNFARDLKLALRHGRKIAFAYLPQYSKLIHSSAYSQKYRVGLDSTFVSIISNRTFVPKYLGFAMHTSALGFWSKYLVEFGIGQENVEQLIARVFRRTDWSDVSLDDILSRSPRANMAARPLKELKKIWSKLATVARAFPTASPVAFAHLKLKDQEFFMLPISENTIQNLPSMEEFKRMLESGKHFNLHKAGFLHEMQYKIPTTIGFPIVVSVRIPVVSQMSGQIRMELRNPFKLHANNIKPAVAASLLTSVTIWNPVVAAGLKIVANAKLCAPVSAKITAQLKGRMPEMKVEMEPVSKPIEWIRLETRPMTFTRVYRFPITTYPKADYKTVMGEQWNRINNLRDFPALRQFEFIVKKTIGQDLKVDGIWHHTPVDAPTYLPICPFSGPNHISVKTQPMSPVPMVMKIAAEAKEVSSFKSESFEWPMEQDLLLEDYESEKAWETMIKAQLYTKGSEMRKAEAECKLQFSPEMRVVKQESKFEIFPVPEVLSRPVKLCSKGFIQYPRSVQNFAELRGKAVVGELKATWGWETCKEENMMEVKMAAKQSPAQSQWWSSEPEMSWYAESKVCEEEPERCSPVQMQDPLYYPQQMLDYYFVAKYENLSPLVKNMTAKMLRALKNYYYWSSDVVNFDIRNPAGVVKAHFTVEPKQRSLFNLTIKTPVENVSFTDAALPMPLVAPVSIRRMWEPIRSPADFLDNVLSPVLPMCRLNSRRVQTFDGVSFRAPLSTCWTLLAKDCDEPEQPQYAVLAKKLSSNSNQKIVKIITPTKTIILRPESSEYESVKVKMNGKELPQSELPLWSSEVSIRKEWGMVNVKTPEVRVSFDGYEVKIAMSPLMSQSQCGICGHYDGEEADEYYSPKMERLNDLRSFIRSYTINENKCAFPGNLNDIDSDEQLDYEPEWRSESRYQQLNSNEMLDSSEDEMMMESGELIERPTPSVNRRVVQEEQGKICVSTEPVPFCPYDSMPVDYEPEERELTFKCISRTHYHAYRLLKSIRLQSQPLNEDIIQILNDLPTAYTSSVPIPTQCQRNF